MQKSASATAHSRVLCAITRVKFQNQNFKKRLHEAWINFVYAAFRSAKFKAFKTEISSHLKKAR